jgi:hypothetical protein
LRRQTGAGGAALAGSSRDARLDPFTLPLYFSTADARADGGTRLVELHQRRVIVRRAVRGMTMAVNVPLRAYLGVALHLQAPYGEELGTVSVRLEHRDPGLSLPLFVASDGVDIIAEWHSWARVLGLPLLVGEHDGALREAFPQLGLLRIAAPIARRRWRGSVRRRRPSILLRRKPGQAGAMPVHRGEREIIARN